MARAALVAALAAGCGAGPTGMQTGQVSGAFAAERFAFTSAADPADVVDLLASGGGFTLELDGSGGFRSVLVDASGDEVQRSGSVAVQSSRIVFDEDPFTAGDVAVPRVLEFRRVGNVLLLADAGAEFDFDGDGVADDALLEVDLAGR